MSSVKALSLSESVPDWMILAKKLDSEDEDEDVAWNVWMSFSWREAALSERDARWAGIEAGGGEAGAGSGERAECQCEVGGKTNDVFEPLKVILVGNVGFVISIVGLVGSGCECSGTDGPLSFFLSFFA